MTKLKIDSKISKWLGIMLIVFGLLFNKWFVGFMFAPSGVIQTNIYVYLIVLFQAAAIIFGLFMVIKRPSFNINFNMKINKKKFIFYILFISISLLFIFSMLELGTRFLNLAPLLPKSGIYVPDEYLPYKMLPNYSANISSRTDEFEFEYKTNSLGFRDSEHSLEKPKNVFRIIGVGDSFTQGSGASFEEGYLCRLETMLNSRDSIHPKIEVINMGMSRFFPEPERLVLQYYGCKYKPDLILVGFLPNDVIDTYVGIDAIGVKNNFLKTKQAIETGKIGTWLYLHSHLCRVILTKYVSYQKNKEKPHPHSSEIYKSNGSYEKDWRKIEEEYSKMVELANNSNSEIIFIHIPQGNLFDKSTSYPALRLSNWCAQKGIPFIDTLPALKKNTEKGKILYWEKDGHCNSEGYKVIAEVIFSELTRQGLVP